jgi:hypothetical protein
MPMLDQPNIYRAIDYSKSVYDPVNRLPLIQKPEILRCPSDPFSPRSSNGLGVSNYAGCHHDGEAPIDSTNNGLFYRNSHLRIKDVPDGLSCTLLIGEKTLSMYDLGWMSGTRATLRNAGSPVSIIKMVRNVTPARLQGSEDEFEVSIIEDQLNVPKAEPLETNPPDEFIVTGFPTVELTETSTPRELEVYSEDGTLRGFSGLATGPLEVGGFVSYHRGGFNLMTGDGSTRFWAFETDALVLKQLANRHDGLPLSVPE